MEPVIEVMQSLSILALGAAYIYHVFREHR